MGLKKRGIFFSIDAVVALLIILMAMFVAFPLAIRGSPQLHSNLPEDILTSLSLLSMQDISGEISNPEILEKMDSQKTVLEQIAIFSVTDLELAEELAEYILQEVETVDNVGLWMGNKLVWSSGSDSYDENSLAEIKVQKQIISGVQDPSGTTASGYAARAFLSSLSRTKYYYFGGYVGDGNISAYIPIEGTVTGASMELAINNNFSLYINGNFAGNYQKSDTPSIPKEYTISPQYLQYFIGGNNLISLTSSNNLYIAGGYVKIVYESDSAENTEINYLSGVSGLINIYDSFYSPNPITEIEMKLVANTQNQKAFVSIGDKRIYEFNTSSLEVLEISNDTIASYFPDFSELSGETIPFRIGLDDVTFQINTTLDLISVNDITASMGAYKTQMANANRILLNNTVLINENIRMGVVTYRAASTSVLFQSLSNNYNTVNSTISNFLTISYASTQRSLCNGIQKAVGEFNDNSPSENIKIAVLMGAGALSNQQCNSQGANVYEKTKNAACDAYQQHGIIFYAVGFGTNQDTLNTLQQIADCSGGSYFEGGDLLNLEEIYQQVIQEILLEYQLQTIGQAGGQGQTINTILSPESYIKISHSPITHSPGLILTLEKNFDSENNAVLEIPPDSSVIDAKVVSYSGPKWTNFVSLNGDSVFTLSKYSVPYIDLGDPYSINLPISEIDEENQNQIYLTTGSSQQDPNLGGSTYNKIIYKIVKSINSYSGVKLIARGCNWNIEFENGDLIQGVAVPSNYDGQEVCDYASRIYEPNDAYQVAVYNLLKQLDFDSDGKVDIVFTQQNLELDLSDISGIPFSYQIEAQTRIWL